jgi:hypothetical protein
MTSSHLPHKASQLCRIDLKLGDFEPEFAGKMNFCLSAANDKLRTESDNPSIGLILCRGNNGLVVEYALWDVNKPMAVSEYTVPAAQHRKRIAESGCLRNSKRLSRGCSGAKSPPRLPKEIAGDTGLARSEQPCEARAGRH